MKRKKARVVGYGAREEYTCRYTWPTTYFVQAGIVQAGMSYQKACFFEASPEHAHVEAFPGEAHVFIRGEGMQLSDAETCVWKQYRRMIACTHAFERDPRRRDGWARCMHCKIAGTFLESLEHCVVCGVPTYFHHQFEHWYCREHTPARHTPASASPYWREPLREGR